LGIWDECDLDVMGGASVEGLNVDDEGRTVSPREPEDLHSREYVSQSETDTEDHRPSRNNCLVL
jgi:hypothetical protein